MKHTIYCYDDKRELNHLVQILELFFNVDVVPLINGWRLDLDSKLLQDSLNDLPENMQQYIFNFFRPKFESKKGRRRLTLPTKEELEEERYMYRTSVAGLAKKYNCSVATINRRLGLIRTKRKEN